ncbi:ABC transporter substrate-binding protein [Streptomyces paludis]|uniref:ABC transporter substrate-binding protein n=1 Tax=Streptomyces paludis TaxID=2282738 RepID=A0A345HLM2_9ACTN|nr:ABC transporter substrate-binding protein [Streptomyces paludis]AXG77596.1 ABC transporter substrate-binding protein [Streptomyces paludis]
MPRVRRTAALALALTALLFPLAACGGSADATSTSTSTSTSSDGADAAKAGRETDLSSVTLAVGDTGWARQESILKLAGLDKTPYRIKWSVFQGGDLQLQAMRAGALDVAQSSEIPPVFAAADGKANFKVVAVQRASTLLQEVVAPKGSPLTGIAQLKGKKVGYVKNTTAQYFLYELLKQAGLEWSDIEAVPLLPDAGLAALTGGSVDALASYGNAIIAAHAQGATTIGSGADILSGNFNWEASDKTIADPAKRAAAADLIARIGKGWDYIRDGHEKDFAKVTAAATHQPLEQALSQLRDGEKQRPNKVGPTTPEAIASAQKVADAFHALGALQKPLTVSDFWTDALNADLAKARSGEGDTTS